MSHKKTKIYYFNIYNNKLTVNKTSGESFSAVSISEYMHSDSILHAVEAGTGVDVSL